MPTPKCSCGWEMTLSSNENYYYCLRCERARDEARERGKTLVEVFAEDEGQRRCPHDGGFCHHDCAEGECFREAGGMSLSTPYPGYPLPGHGQPIPSLQVVAGAEETEIVLVVKIPGGCDTDDMVELFAFWTEEAARRWLDEQDKFGWYSWGMRRLRVQR